jgi:SPP1 family predicted phage head-tail adaptor
MYWRDVGYLVTETEELDKFNRPKPVYSYNKIFCNKKAIKGVEFYQAQAQGIKPELVVEVREYNNEEHFKFNDKLYRVIRNYSKNDEITELVLTSTLTDNELTQ